MPDWTPLFEKLSAQSERSSERARRLSDELTAQHEFDAWAEFAVGQVLGELHRVAVQRGKELLTRYGLQVSIGEVLREPGPGLTSDTWFLTVGLQADPIYLYSTLQSGRLPHVHIGYQGEPGYPSNLTAPPSRRATRRRMVTLPGAALVRTPSYGVALQRVTTSGDPGHTTSADALVFRAFELLALQRPWVDVYGPTLASA